MSDASEFVIDGKVELRPRPSGKFDELVLRDKPDGECIVHAEMMDKGCLWIGIYPPGETAGRRVSLWIRAEKGKLSVNALVEGAPTPSADRSPRT